MAKYLVRTKAGDKYWSIKKGVSRLVTNKAEAERFESEYWARHYMSRQRGDYVIEEVED